MEFHEKLQAYRRQKGLTQEELAEILFVSRAAVSKWESGRGYPNLDSLKSIARFFSVTIDDLLSGEEVLTIAENDHKQKERQSRDRIFGLLDCSIAMLLVLPLFGQTADSRIREVSLLQLSGIAPYLRVLYLAGVLATIAWGILGLALQTGRHPLWLRWKRRISFLLNGIGALLFILGRQPYAAIFILVFLAIKVLMITKKHPSAYRKAL